MAIQIPNPGTGNGASGDNEFVLWSKVKDNFSDPANAASRLVGKGAEQIPLTKDIPSVLDTIEVLNPSTYTGFDTLLSTNSVPHLSRFYFRNSGGFPYGIFFKATSSSGFSIIYSDRSGDSWNKFPRVLMHQGIGSEDVTTTQGDMLLLGINASKDSNGFLKSASPVIDMYNDTIDLNQDAINQGDITFEKLGAGDYLVKGSLGFAQEGWYIETPKDANGNVLVAVVYEQLANNDLSIKTYAKRFDDETGDIVANLTKPRDIPEGRFISLRLHELPDENVGDIQTEDVDLEK